MNYLTEWLLALLDLLELEGRQFKRHAFRLTLAIALTLVASAVLLAGVLLIGWGVERWLSTLLGPVFSLLLAGGLLVLCAVALVGWGRRLLR